MERQKRAGREGRLCANARGVSRGDDPISDLSATSFAFTSGRSGIIPSIMDVPLDLPDFRYEIISVLLLGRLGYGDRTPTHIFVFNIDSIFIKLI